MTNFNATFQNICESNGWVISRYDDERVEISKYSPAGEDFSFVVYKDDFIKNVTEYAEDFDIDEHIEMWIEARKHGARGVPSTRELVTDAEDISLMLQELASALNSDTEISSCVG